VPSKPQESQQVLAPGSLGCANAAWREQSGWIRINETRATEGDLALAKTQEASPTVNNHLLKLS